MASSDQLSFIADGEFGRIRQLSCEPVAKADLFATMCRLNTFSAIARAGSGHIGSSFSSLDIVSWLYLHEMRRPPAGSDAARDVYFSSKGHDAPGFYSALAGMGLLPERSVRQLRRFGGLPGHPDILTPHVEANTGSLGMGISKAKGMAFASRRAGRADRFFIMTGDGELQEGQIWESLVSAANHGLAEITVIVDHNKLQSDTQVARTSHLGDLEAKFAAFGWHVDRCDGHDLRAFATVIESQRGINKPKVIIADTIKGRGVSFMESTRTGEGELYRFHSGAPSSNDYIAGLGELTDRANAQLKALGQPPLRLDHEPRPAVAAALQPQRLVAAYSRALVAAGERDPRIVVLDADLVLDTGQIPFRTRFPDRFLECGIAEQDMCSQASGMALRGLLPIVNSFACFLAARPNEQIYNNATERTKIIYVGSLAGLIPSGPGHSHQSVRDISALRGMPGLSLIEPSCERETELAVEWATTKAPGSVYLRLVSVPRDIPYSLPADYILTPGKGVTLRDSAICEVVVIGYGPVLLPEAVRAAAALSQRGHDVKVVNLPWLDRVDPAWLAETVRNARLLVTLDNHYLVGGQGEMLAAAIADLRLARQPKILRLGVDRIPECGLNDEALREHGLDANGIAAACLGALSDAHAKARTDTVGTA